MTERRAKMRFLRDRFPLFGLLLGLVLSGFPGFAAAAPPKAASLDFAYLELEDDPRYQDDKLHARNLGQPVGRPYAGAEVALREARYVAGTLGVAPVIERVVVSDAATLQAAVDRLHKKGVRYFLADLPGPLLAQLAAATRGRELLIFNVSAADDALRQAQCQRHLLHTIPSHAMVADALAQYLVERKWRNVLLLQGSGAEDALQGAAFERAARRFGLKITAKRNFVLSNDPRQRELGNVGLLTANVDYDAVFVADADGEFARSVPYRTVRPRPVVGSEGLVAAAWHWSWERQGAPQLNGRFEKHVGHTGQRMGAADWAAWMAVKSVVEALQRTGSTDFRKLSDYLRSQDITLDGFKGSRLSFRPWDNQLRQPLLLATHNAVVERAPLDGFLHQSNKLDTLGFDAPDSQCRMLP
jgi:ABC transporter substrate binding protein (PQQ-dependent alcohol dehydrogenase system)